MIILSRKGITIQDYTVYLHTSRLVAALKVCCNGNGGIEDYARLI